MPVAVVKRNVTGDPPLLRHLPVVIDTHICLFRVGHALRAREACAAIGKERLCRGLGFRVDGCSRHLGSKAVAEQSIRAFPKEFAARHVLLLLAVRVRCATPLTVTDWTARVVGVVRVAIQRDSRIVGEPERKGTAHIAVVGAVARLHIAEVALPV